jgi:uncharacterized protein
MAGMEKSQVAVEDVPAEKHLRALVDGRPAGRADYIRTGELVAFVHTEVSPEFEGMGVGSALARAAVELVQEAGLKLLPVCPFIAGWLDRHPEYDGLRYRAASRVTD